MEFPMIETIVKGLYHLTYQNNLELASTFLRFQEHYESPEFSGKIFSLDEYKQWYTKVNGNFSYYEDWTGFNVPGHILKPFYEGKFDPISMKEYNLLEIFKYDKQDFYIIGTSFEKNGNEYLEHEIVHGLFYLRPEYRKNVLEVLPKYETTCIREFLRDAKSGYSEAVLDDETNAYIVANLDDLKAECAVEPGHKQLYSELRGLFLEELHR